jgi:hypothetical protein
MSVELEVNGLASKAIIANDTIDDKNGSITLLNFLRDQGLGIASSCDYEGVCYKCEFNCNLFNETRSCQVLLSEIIDSKESKISISFDYL